MITVTPRLHLSLHHLWRGLWAITMLGGMVYSFFQVDWATPRVIVLFTVITAIIGVVGWILSWLIFRYGFVVECEGCHARMRRILRSTGYYGYDCTECEHQVETTVLWDDD